MEFQQPGGVRRIPIRGTGHLTPKGFRQAVESRVAIPQGSPSANSFNPIPLEVMRHRDIEITKETVVIQGGEKTMLVGRSIPPLFLKVPRGPGRQWFSCLTEL